MEAEKKFKTLLASFLVLYPVASVFILNFAKSHFGIFNQSINAVLGLVIILWSQNHVFNQSKFEEGRLSGAIIGLLGVFSIAVVSSAIFQISRPEPLIMVTYGWLGALSLGVGAAVGPRIKLAQKIDNLYYSGYVDKVKERKSR